MGKMGVMRGRAWNIAAGGIWGAVLGVLLVRAGVHPGRATSLSTYLAGGEAWEGGSALYTNWRGFVYPPAVAWGFGFLSRAPVGVAAVAWRALTAGTLLLGLGAILRAEVFYRIPPGTRGLVFVGVLPLSIGNIDNAQANPLIAGLMMLAVAALQWEAWTLCAVAAGVATVFKIYPVALALLLCVLRPRQLWWRLALVLAGLALLPFALKDPHYVAGQYHAWLSTRLADDRFQYPMKDAPLDLWFLLVRVGMLPVNERAYAAFQALAGGAVAGVVWKQSRRDTDVRDVLATLFLLVSVWMLLLGPATENQTYVVLAPAACVAAVESLYLPRSLTRGLAFTAFGLLLAAAARNSLAPHLKSPLLMTIQPVAALVLLCAILSRGVTPPAPRYIRSAAPS